MRNKMMFLDGYLVPEKKSLVQSLTPGILSGKGVFETMRSYDGKIFALKEHLHRMRLGLKALGIALPLSEEKIRFYIYRALVSNRLKNARVRLTVWQGSKTARISIIVLSYQSHAPLKYRRGFKGIISDIRYDRADISPHVKSINYLSLMAASRQARKSGNDEALLLNSKGYVVEGSRTNIFFIKGKILCTPDLLSGCLRGITRQQVLAIGPKLGLKTKQVLAKPEDIFSADEAFLTNSLLGIMPLTSLQGRLIGQGRMGPWTEKILNSYAKLVLQELA